MPDLHKTANPEIQNPFKPDEKIRLSELMGLIDEKTKRSWRPIPRLSTAPTLRET